MARTKWYEQDNPNPDRVAGWFGIRLVIIIVAVLAISAGIWGLTVLVSGPKGQGDVHKQNQSAQNRIKAQAEFEGLYAGIIAADKKIDIHAAALKASPKDFVLQTNYTAAQSVCTTLVADYDAAARKTTFADWRAEDLPSRIDVSDPATDCKESTK